MIQAVTLELFNHLPREFRQECQIVSAVDDERFLGPSRKFIEVCHGTDREPGLPQFLQVNLLFDSLPDMPGGLPMPDDIRKVCGGVIERCHPNPRIVRGGNER